MHYVVGYIEVPMQAGGKEWVIWDTAVDAVIVYELAEASCSCRTFLSSRKDTVFFRPSRQLQAELFKMDVW